MERNGFLKIYNMLIGRTIGKLDGVKLDQIIKNKKENFGLHRAGRPHQRKFTT